MIKKVFRSKLFYMSTIVLLSSCGNHSQEGYPEQIVSTDFKTLQYTQATTEKKYVGTIEGSVNVDVKAQVSGYLESIYVKEGDYVTQGQSLFKIKADVFNEQVNTSRAAFQAALAAQKTAELELEKIQPLVAGKVFSPLQLETVKAQYEAAKAQVAQAKSTLESSQINAAFTIIKAPVSGYIGRIPNRVGNLITSTDSTPLTMLSEINTVFVYFSLSEAEFITFLKESKQDPAVESVEMLLADGTIYEHKGKIEMASGNVDRTTGSIILKAVFSNPDKLLRAGGSTKVILTNHLKDVITIPAASVRDIQNKSFVFALTNENTVEMRSIEIQGRSGTNYIVKSGLALGEKIALNSIDVLQDGMTVDPTIKNQ